MPRKLRLERVFPPRDKFKFEMAFFDVGGEQLSKGYNSLQRLQQPSCAEIYKQQREYINGSTFAEYASLTEEEKRAYDQTWLNLNGEQWLDIAIAVEYLPMGGMPEVEKYARRININPSDIELKRGEFGHIGMECFFLDLTDFSEDSTRYGFINQHVNPDYTVFVQTLQGEVGLYNLKTKTVALTGKYAKRIYNGGSTSLPLHFIQVRKGNKIGVVNSLCEEILPCVYDAADIRQAKIDLYTYLTADIDNKDCSEEEAAKLKQRAKWIVNTVFPSPEKNYSSMRTIESDNWWQH